MNVIETLGEMLPDSLFAGSAVTALVKGVYLKGGQGLLKRGTLLASTPDSEEYVIYGGEGNTVPDCILTDDTDTGNVTEETEDGTETGLVPVFATAYQSGMFAEQKIILSDGYEITEKDKTELRKLNIILSKIMRK